MNRNLDKFTDFLSQFPPEEVDDELLAYAAERYCQLNPTTKYSHPAHRFTLENRLHGLKMEEGEKFKSFFDKFVCVYAELDDMGRTLDEESLVFLIINALPDSWKAFVEVCVLMGLYMLTLEDVMLKIFCEEETGEIRAENRKVIARSGRDTKSQPGDSAMISNRRSNEKDKESCMADSSLTNAYSTWQKWQPRGSDMASNRRNNEEDAKLYMVCSSLTIADTNSQISQTRVSEMASSVRSYEKEELFMACSSLTIADANPQILQTRDCEMPSNRRSNKKDIEGHDGLELNNRGH